MLSVNGSNIEVARDLATSRRLYVVLKGSRTVVATPDGAVWINVTGNPGMATGGTGDVLTGVVAAWVAQLVETETACALAVCVHGMAGDLAAAAQGEVGMIASDLGQALGAAVQQLSADGGATDDGPPAS